MCYYEALLSSEEPKKLIKEQLEIHEEVKKFSNIFSDTVGLPPLRERYNLIHLVPNAQPVNVRPIDILNSNW